MTIPRLVLYRLDGWTQILGLSPEGPIQSPQEGTTGQGQPCLFVLKKVHPRYIAWEEVLKPGTKPAREDTNGISSNDGSPA